MKRARRELDEAIQKAWHDLNFKDDVYSLLSMPEDEYRKRTQLQVPEWEALLATTYEDGAWKVEAGIAIMLSTSLWHSAMFLQDYGRAEEVIERCLGHPGPFSRFDTAELPIRLHTTRWVRDRNPEAAQALRALVNCGTYRPGAMARSISHTIACWIEPLGPTSHVSTQPLTNDTRALALALAVALRASKRHQRASEEIQTWEEFGLHIAHSAGFSPLTDHQR